MLNRYVIRFGLVYVLSLFLLVAAHRLHAEEPGCEQQETLAEDVDYRALLAESLSPDDGFLDPNTIRSILINAVTAHLEKDPSTSSETLIAQADQRPVTELNLSPNPRRRTRERTPEDLFLRARESTAITAIVYKCSNCPDHHINYASAFVIGNDGIFVTNYHVLKTAESMNAKVVMVTADGRLFSVKEVLAANASSDLAIVRTDGTGLTPFTVEPNVRVGEKVYCLSHPRGYFYLFTNGIVAGKAIEENNGAPSSRLYVTADYAVGSSGGPIINANGDLVGIVSATRSAKTGTNLSEIQMVIGLTIPATELISLIQ